MVALSSISFSKYKGFDEWQRLELRPVTLLFGHNSVGKSAALRLIPTLSDAASIKEIGKFSPSVLDYSSAALRGATFLDLVNKNSKAGTLHFALRWGSLEFSVAIKQTTAPRKEFISSFTIESPEINLKASATDPTNDSYELEDGSATVETTIQFDGLMPRVFGSIPEAMVGAIRAVAEQLRRLATSVHWIAAVRAQPPRMFTLEPGTRIGIDHNGGGVAEALRASAIMGDGVVGEVSAWLAEACNCELTFAATDGEVFQDREWFPFNVTPLGVGGPVAVPDVGEGVAQALPVITLCRQAARGLLGDNPILALEQPELHLHPHAGSLLATAVADCVANGSSAYHVVETHSENFLLAMQVALLEKKISKEQLIVYWVQAGSNGSSLRRIEFDDDGFPSAGWPEGVFREALEQAQRISQLRLA